MLFFTYLLLQTTSPFVNADQQVIRLIKNAENQIEKGHFSEAAQLLEAAEKKENNNSDIYRVWGDLFRAQQDWVSAEKQYAKWAELEPNSFLPYEDLGEVSYKQERFEESNLYFTKAISLNPKRAYLWSYRCHIYALQNEWQLAVDDCSKAIQLKPNYKYALRERARAYEALGETEKANQGYKEADREYQYLTISMRVLIDYLYPLILAGLSLAFLFIGYSVSIRKKPMIFHSRWHLAPVCLLFFPILMNNIYFNGLRSDFSTLNLMLTIAPLIYLFVLISKWREMHGYTLVGIEKSSFRNALIAILESKNIEYEEKMSSLCIPKENPELQISIPPWIGNIRIRHKGKGSNSAFTNIINDVKKRFSNSEITAESTAGAFYLAIGVLLIGFAILMTHYKM